MLNSCEQGPRCQNTLVRLFFCADSDGRLNVWQVWELQSVGMDTAHPVWLPAQVALDAGQDFTLLLEGQAANGGFAVDDISLSPGSCPSKEMFSVY